ncbi:MAG: DUF1553 domain-containing protein [Planctomycetota bacterium]|nr:DUF1553 domain-containing protein [Planctomycetota bacterium]
MTAALSLLAAFALGTTPHDAGRVDFQRDVQPLLADRCFACHGPDAAKRKAELRLDLEESARDVVDGGAKAELAQRILSDDPRHVMPPPSLKRPLDERERATLLAWLEQGAPYARHWAFVAPQRAPIPDVRDKTWPRDELDRHVLARLEALGIAPAPPASPLRLVRRLSLVLTGLPPTPEVADAFAADPSEAAYERLVDELLASPRAAEHAASVWLDLARYADTYGYQTDGDRAVWPWRDWLLRALADNVPYDVFVTKLLAGDLLENPTVEDHVATAFQRLHRMTEEGGSTPEEFRQEAIADRVGTFGTSFLGLTLDCARCHDHKYDPLPQREFYALGAMFGAIDENGLKPYALGNTVPAPFVRLVPEADRARAEELAAAVQVAERELDKALQAARERAPLAQLAPEALAVPAPVAHYSFEQLDNGRFANSVDATKPANTDRRRPEQLGTVTVGEGRVGKAVLFDGDGGLGLEGFFSGTRFDERSFSLWLRPTERNARAALVQMAGFYTQDADATGLELEIVDGHLRWSAIHLWPGSAASVRCTQPLELGRWTHVVATYDGSSRAAGLRLYVDGQTAVLEVVRDELDGPFENRAIEIGSRSRGNGFRGGAIDELRLWDAELSAHQARSVALADGVAAPADSVDRATEHYIERVDADVLAARKRLRDAQRASAAFVEAFAMLPCMRDSRWVRPTYVLRRGSYEQPDLTRPVEPGALEAVLPFDPALPRNRLGLARWLFDPGNPLTARVAVDRLWRQVFGLGMLETPENFGLQGARPTHPELFDTLAFEFANGDVEPGSAWNVRRMLRRLVLSSTFRQDSSATKARRELDPDGALHSRGPSVRLSAEMQRDSALCASGLLVERFGGPSVRPWQPEGLWNEAGQTGQYVPDLGEGAHRRSLYTYTKRTVPVPDMSVFDAGPRETCVARRGATNTPLQVLTLLNDPVFVECARALAVRATREVTDVAARLERAFRLVATRVPTDEERAALAELVASETARYSTNPADALALCGAEDAELAALTLACSVILSSDEARNVR